MTKSVALSLLGLLATASFVMAVRAVTAIDGSVWRPMSLLRVLGLAILFTLLALVAAAVLFGLVTSTAVDRD